MLQLCEALDKCHLLTERLKNLFSGLCLGHSSTFRYSARSTEVVLQHPPVCCVNLLGFLWSLCCLSDFDPPCSALTGCPLSGAQVCCGTMRFPFGHGDGIKKDSDILHKPTLYFSTTSSVARLASSGLHGVWLVGPVA